MPKGGHRLHLKTCIHRFPPPSAGYPSPSGHAFSDSHLMLPPSCEETVASSSKNKPTPSSPKDMQAAALRSFWQPHFDSNRKFTTVSVLIMENKRTQILVVQKLTHLWENNFPFPWGTGSFSLNIWKQASPGNCVIILCVCGTMDWTRDMRPTGLTPLLKPERGFTGGFLPLNLTPPIGNKHSQRVGKQPIKKPLAFSAPVEYHLD